MVKAAWYIEAGKRHNFFMSFPLIGFVLLFILAGFNLSAQEEGARIYHVDGNDFAITIRGERTVMKDQSAGVDGIILERSGIVHTGKGTFLELQFPSGAVMKLSENTSIVYNGVDHTGNFTDLGLLCGRIRIVTETGAVVVRCGGVSARMSFGDMGVDYILNPDIWSSAPRPVFRAYSFRGVSEIFPYGRSETSAYFGGIESLSAEENESLSVDISSTYTYADKKALGDDIVEFWVLHNFAGFPQMPMPGTAIAQAINETGADDYTPEPPLTVEPVPVIPSSALTQVQSGESTPFFSGYRNKNLLLVSGLVLTVASLAAQAFSYFRYNDSNPVLARNIFRGVYGSFTVGIGLSLAGILYNPRPEK